MAGSRQHYTTIMSHVRQLQSLLRHISPALPLAQSNLLLLTSRRRPPVEPRASHPYKQHINATMATDTQPATQQGAPFEVTTEPLMMWSWVCPYVHRVTLALAHKQTKIKTVDIDLNNKPSWLTKYSPLGKVPAVTYEEDGEQQVLYESLALISWVDEYYKGRTLLQGTPAQRCKERIIISRYDNEFVSTWYKALRCTDKSEFKAIWEKLNTELDWLEKNIHPTGVFLMGGSQPGLVDAAVAPWLLRNHVLHHYRHVDLLQGRPRLTAFLQAYLALPEVAEHFQYPSKDGYDCGYEGWSRAQVSAYAKYGGNQIDFSDVASSA